MRVFKVNGDKAIADCGNFFQLVARFGNQLFDLRRQTFGRVDGNDAAEGRIQIGPEGKDRAVVAEKIVFSIGFIKQLDNLRVWIDKVLVEDPVLRIGTALDSDDEITAIVRDLGIEEP